jgi:GNAT superfamily N-acetyltransferase
MGDIQIRRAAAGDVDGFVASSAGLFAEDAGSYDDTVDVEWPRKHGAARFLEGLADPHRLVLVAVDVTDAIIGHLTGLVSEPTAMRPLRVATLSSLYVFSEHRRGGVGARLVAEFRDWARRRNTDRLEVTAYAANDSALRFYRRQGFAPQSILLEALP